MAIRVALYHRTAYRYDRPVQLSPHVVRLRPAPHCRTPIRSYSLTVEPSQHFINWQQDIQGNHQARLVFPEPSRELSVTVDVIAELEPINPFDFFVDPSADRYPFAYDPDTAAELQPYLRVDETGPRFDALVAELCGIEGQVIDVLVRINGRIHQLVSYLIRMEPGIQKPEETLTLGRGSCRDSAWLQVQLLRRLGIAARFASGYLIQLAADEKPVDGPAGPETDFTDLHAWCEAYVPGAGWIGLDATSGLLAGEGHLPLACTAEASNAAPITGGFTTVDGKEVDCQFDFEMRLDRIYETPRATKPYHDGFWDKIDACGNLVDRKLADAGLELTMGGEPTFIALDDMDADEWNTAALGPTKRRRAEALFERLGARFGSGALLHHGQGKWYPGEPLPRWAMACYWRVDGEPLWRDQHLLSAGRPPPDHGVAEAERLIKVLGERLDVGAATTFPAFEDPFYVAWRERRLPVNADLDAVDPDAPERREHLYRCLTEGIKEPTGWILPIEDAAGDGSRWRSGRWFLRDERCLLLPGDSPLGFRLPLDSLPVAPPDEHREPIPDPLDEHADLPPPEPPPPAVVEAMAAAAGGPLVRTAADGPTRNRPQLQQHKDRCAREWETDEQEPPAPGEPCPNVVRTALCVEPRGGHLFVFMPPVPTLSGYIALVAAVEDAAAACGLPVVIEGYQPPRDPRIQVLQVTPDPGVIEINVHPSGNWGELVGITRGVFEDARLCGLGAEKFELDGRTSGTGGGNHITLGGPEPGRSPFLLKPVLLRSLIAFWINHPSLSYCFSGQYIGATSQAPRPDEARIELVSELELALKELDHLGDDVPPWKVDRILRNLLIDVTGNTHRSEICIDKLFSPDSASGRLGIVELRGFEMPPHPEMGMAQILLVRGLIAAFAEKPYREPLARWGHQLMDRFLLPTFLEQDLRAVCRFLEDRGIPVDPEWFMPHLAFRFPPIGEIIHEGMRIELRHALEPWPVLGEENTGGGTARFVDNSIERIEVRTTGLDPRFVVTCNRAKLPLQPIGRDGQAVAGVRFRTWLPVSCLHPTVEPHEPLIFDLVDTELGRSVTGCTYWATHPGGRNHETRPVNANEASGRRQARFAEAGHSPGPIRVIAWERQAEYPHTLDLRHLPPDA